MEEINCNCYRKKCKVCGPFLIDFLEKERIFLEDQERIAKEHRSHCWLAKYGNFEHCDFCCTCRDGIPGVCKMKHYNPYGQPSWQTFCERTDSSSEDSNDNEEQSFFRVMRFITGPAR